MELTKNAPLENLLVICCQVDDAKSVNSRTELQKSLAEIPQHIHESPACKQERQLKEASLQCETSRGKQGKDIQGKVCVKTYLQSHICTVIARVVRPFPNLNLSIFSAFCILT